MGIYTSRGPSIWWQLAPTVRASPTARQPKNPRVPSVHTLRMLCSKLGLRARAGHSQALDLTSSQSTSSMEAVTGEVGDELAGAPAALRSAPASCAPFPGRLQPSVRSPPLLGQLWHPDIAHDVG